MLENPDVELWATAISKNDENGRRIFWRYAKDLRAGFDRSAQSDRIIIVWRYASENGQPDSTEHAQMNRMEDALEAALRSSRLATLTLVSTGENLREWTYYAQSENAFIELLDEALQNLPQFPIEIHTAHDPTWNMYEKFRADNPRT